jgi:hypothetical protein
MKKAIVTTTINSPTEALKKFAEIAIRDGWTMIIVGDVKTPYLEYQAFCEQYEGAVTYMDLSEQKEISSELDQLIGYSCIQRRNFGLIKAYNDGAEIIATVDDDNIPYKNWGKNLSVGTDVKVNLYTTKSRVFDPLSPILPSLWHRGFPLQLLGERTLSAPRPVDRRILVQADLWDGNPDVDAICRIALMPEVTFDRTMSKFMGNVAGPFNSQNTFLHRSVIADYFLFPEVGRMDDIFASYWLQARYPGQVCYAPASVYQARNEHDLVKDLEAEMIGYKHSLAFFDWARDNASQTIAADTWPEFFPRKSIKAFQVYRSLLK